MGSVVLLRVIWVGALIVGTCTPVGAKPQLADRIVAVVDDEIVLYSEVVTHLRLAVMQQGGRDLESDEIEALFQTVLKGMVDEKLLLARAEEDSIEVDDERVEEAMRTELRGLKAQYGEEQFAQQLQQDGLTEREIREQLRQKYRKDFLRQAMYGQLAQKVTVSYKDVEAFRKEYREQLPSLLGISHILIEIKPSEDRQAGALKRAVALWERIQSGEDFAELARQYSEDPGSAPGGGDLGFFARGGFVPEFEEKAFALKPGEVSEPVKTEFGYHIIRVDAVRGDQIQVRHILIAMKPDEVDAQAVYQSTLELYERIQAGEDFAELAKQHSADQGSAELGGRLGAFLVENLPVAFKGVVGGMKLGEVSPPFRTEFGWHLLKLNDDRESLEDILKQLRMQKLFREVLDETRKKLYVDIRAGEE